MLIEDGEFDVGNLLILYAISVLMCHIQKNNNEAGTLQPPESIFIQFSGRYRLINMRLSQ